MKLTLNNLTNSINFAYKNTPKTPTEMYRSRENNIDPVLKQRKGDSNIESVTTTKRDSDQNTTKL